MYYYDVRKAFKLEWGNTLLGKTAQNWLIVSTFVGNFFYISQREKKLTMILMSINYKLYKSINLIKNKLIFVEKMSWIDFIIDSLSQCLWSTTYYTCLEDVTYSRWLKVFCTYISTSKRVHKSIIQGDEAILLVLKYPHLKLLKFKMRFSF